MTSISSSWTSVFDVEFDTVVFGSGYAGVAAALERRDRGDRVLLVSARGDVLWESGQAFARELGSTAHPLWDALVGGIERRGGRSAEATDGAVAELIGMSMLRDARVEMLFYARPVAVERTGDGVVGAVVVATKGGMRTVRAARWIDTTERAELLRLVDPSLDVPRATRVRATAMLQHPDWPEALAGRLTATAWPGERVIDVVGDEHTWRDALFGAIDAVCEELGEAASRACVSHLSAVALPEYDAPATVPLALENVLAAVPALGGAVAPADRFALGISAAQGTEAAPRATGATRGARVAPVAERTADVVVVGVGTGGVLAAVASAGLGARVVGIEGLAFPGGVGTAGGIHAYWFGAPGGLQAELDRRTHAYMNGHGRGPFRDGPYNPWAKRRAVEQLLAESGAEVLCDAIVFAAERDGEHVTAVLAATPEGVVRVAGEVFVDATGDGDLCELAGAEFDGGRQGDALLHAYSQSSGRLREIGGEVRMDVVNFDAGYCDATDVEDLTRARVDGVLLYLVEGRFTNLDRPTYIAPAVGIREARRVRTDLRLELDDVIRRRRFPDAVGYTAAHVDSHGSDFEFDSDESVFWQMLNRAWGVSVGSELSYRMLLPRGLANVVIGSRCLGVSQDAHYAVRMQRDMQRVGEVAGRAAALALACGGDVRAIALDRLQEQLEESTALGRPPRIVERGFGVAHDISDAPRERTQFDLGGADDADEREVLLGRALAHLDDGRTGEAIWWLMRHEELARDAVLARLGSPDPKVSWLAAGIAAMWGAPESQSRLLQAIADEEYGFAGVQEDVPDGTGAYVPRAPEPLTWHKLSPNWLTAIALVRRCGDIDALDALERFVARSTRLGLSTATALLLTIERLFERGVGASDPQRIRTLVDEVLARPLEGVRDYTSRASGYFAEKARRGETVVDWAEFNGLTGVPAEQLRNMYVDMAWQVELVAARIAVLLGDDPGRGRFARDPRGFVRTAARTIGEVDA